MSEPHVSLDPADLTSVERKLQGPLEDQLSSAMQAAAHRVAAGYHGQSVERVCDELLAETRRGLHPDIAEGFAPDRGALRQVALAIVAGEYR